MILRHAGVWGNLAGRVRMLRESRDAGKAVSPEDEIKLLEPIRQSRSRALLPLFVLSFDSGLRASEVRAHDPGSVKDFQGETDRCQAADFIGYLTESDRELEAWLKLLYIQAEQLVARYWYAIEAVAAALLEHRTLNGKQVREVIYQADRVTSGANIGPSPHLAKSQFKETL
jgi:hypothetical protein